MKKLFVIAVAILSFSAVNAQVAYLGFQSVAQKSTIGSNTHTESPSGFFLGGAMNFEIAEGIGVQPALELTFNTRKENIPLTGDVKYPSWGLRVPIDFNYGFELSPDFKLYAFAGPSIYLGLSSKAKSDDDSHDNYKDDIKRFGLGLGFGAWCDFRDMIRLKIGYDLGLTNRYQDTSNDRKFKENAFMISVGYLF